MIDWEKQPNGKWKIKSKTKSKNGYAWNDPEYRKLARSKMRKVEKTCEVCGYYTLAEPCIHHLPDDFRSTKRKQEHWRLMKKKITGDVEESNTTQTIISEDKKR